MKIKTWIKYEVPYLPPRCRKLRYEEKEEFVNINLREVNKRELVLAYEDKSFEGKGKIYRYKGMLWAKAKLHPSITTDERYKDKIKTALDWLIYGNGNFSRYFPHYFDKDKSRECMLKKVKKDMSKLILVDGVLYEKTAKPEYFILTFGCGHGDGTGLFVEYPARRDCGWHFPAEKGAEAVAKAREIAVRRGDIEHANGFKEYIVIYDEKTGKRK